MRTSNIASAVVTALLIGGVAYAGQLVDQGQPGHQGPWPVYIQGLPDGGGGGGPSGSGAANEVTVWSGTNTLTGYDQFKWLPGVSATLFMKADDGGSPTDVSIGMQADWVYPDAGGGFIFSIQTGLGCGGNGIELVDISQTDAGNVQTYECFEQIPVFVYPDAGGGVLYPAPSFVDIAPRIELAYLKSIGGAPIAASYPGSLIALASDNATTEVRVSNGDVMSAGEGYPGLLALINGGPIIGRIGAAAGTGYDWYVTDNTQVGPFGFTYTLDSNIGTGLVEHMDARPNTGGWDFTWLPSGGSLSPTPVTEVKIGVDGTLYNNGTYYDDGGGYCFRDHTCQTTAAVSAASYFVDGGAVGSVQLDRANNQLFMTGDFQTHYAGTTQVDFEVAGNGSGQMTLTDSINRLDVMLGGASPGYIRDEVFFDGGIDVTSQKITRLATGTANTDAANVGQLRPYAPFCGFGLGSGLGAAATVAETFAPTAGTGLRITAQTVVAGSGGSSGVTYTLVAHNGGGDTTICTLTRACNATGAINGTCSASWAANDQLRLNITDDCAVDPSFNVCSTLNWQ